MRCVNVSEVTRHMAGELSPEQAAAVEEHFARCERCAKLRDEMVAMAARLAPDPQEFDDPDLAGEVMTIIKLGRAEPDRAPLSRPRGYRTWLLAPVAAAAVLALAVVAMDLWPIQHREDGLQFQARGGGEERPDRWVSLRVFRAQDTGYRPVLHRLAPDDTLAFAYEDRSPQRYGYLMVFAVDERGEVFWYYPAHVTEGENPQSIRTSESRGPVELPDQVRHDLMEGRLRIFALFSRQALDVVTVENVVARQLAEGRTLDDIGRLPLDETGQQSFLLLVEQPTEGSDR